MEHDHHIEEDFVNITNDKVLDKAFDKLDDSRIKHDGDLQSEGRQDNAERVRASLRFLKEEAWAKNVTERC